MAGVKSYGHLKYQEIAGKPMAYMAQQSPAVTVSHPGRATRRVINPVLRFLLRTPVMGAARNALMVLSFNGRKTGRRYTFPLSAHRIDNDLYALTGAPWKQNFRDGADAEVCHAGKATTMHGEFIQDRSVVADLYLRCAESYGVKSAQRMLGLKFRDERTPTIEEFTAAVEKNRLIAIRLTPAE